MKAAIIAGGKGERIRSISHDLIPKALVPVAGRPILFFQLEQLRRYGVTDVGLILGHLAHEVRRRMSDAPIAQTLKINYFEENLPLGTAGGLLQAKEFFKDDDFFVLYGDIAFDVDLNHFMAYHKTQASIATLVAHPNDHPLTSDLLKVDASHRLLEILPVKTRMPGDYRNLVPAALYCFSPKIFNYIRASEKQDFIHDVFPSLLKEGEKVAVYSTPEYLRDIGTPERLTKVEKDIQTGFMARMNREKKRPTLFLDRDGVINQDLPDTGIIRANQLKLLPTVVEAIKTANDAGVLVIVITNQPQIAKGFMTVDELDHVHARLEMELSAGGAWLDRIYYCPHHPDKGFPGEISSLKIACECRKPGTGLFLQAIKELPVDIHRACMIGDSPRDIRAAQKMNIKAYGVRTELNARVGWGADAPDQVFNTLLEAVREAVHVLDQSPT